MKSPLITSLVFVCLLAIPALGVQVTVQSPVAGATVDSLVQFTATATSANPITGFVVYANNQNVFQTNSSSLNGNVALSTGAYSIYIRAWDSSGTYGTSPTFSITVGAPGVQVAVQSPTDGLTVASPVQFTATATSAHPISGYVVYANDQAVYQTNSSSLNAKVALSSGPYNVYIRAWDSTGAYATSPTFSVKVGTTCPKVVQGVQVSVQSPAADTTTGSLVQFTATASSANPITGFVVYANNQNIYQTNSSSLNSSVALADGIYSVYVRAWDSTGAYGTSATFSITVSSTPTTAKGVQVKVRFPVAGAIVGSPAQFTATASSANPITGFVIYANNQNVLQTNSSSLNGTVALTAGSYSVYIRAWDSTGAYGTSPTFSITVGPTLPTPPSTATVYDIDGTNDSPGVWGSCGDACCAGGAWDAWSWPMYQFQTTPSLDGGSTEFAISGPPYADALHWYKLSAQNWATDYLWESWTYLDDGSLTAQAIEFDLFAVVPIAGVNRKFMFGSQCNYASGVWDGWTEDTSGGGAWAPTNIPCTKFSPNAWHHKVWYFKRVGTNLDQLQYVSLTVDGTTYDANMLQPSQVTTWDQVLGVQYQQDIGPSGASFHQWVDKVKLTIW